MQPTKVQVVVFRRNPADLDIQILALEKPVQAGRGSTWNLLTGFIEIDETPAEAALREVTEETGLENLSPLLNLGHEVTFSSHFTNKPERELAFAIESTDISEEVTLTDNPDHEHISYRWVDPEEAFLILQWDSFKESIHCLLQEIQD